MTHEPECNSNKLSADSRHCTCPALRSAYQRGREDAARDARDEMQRHNDQGEWLSVKDLDVLAAARGENS